MLLATPSGAQRWLLDIADAIDPASCGGKAVGLARLDKAGWAVPPAICLTTDFYRRWLEISGLARRLAEVLADARAGGSLGEILADVRARIEATPLPDDLEVVLCGHVARLIAGRDGVLSVRSSGMHEDDREASHAGIHASVVVNGRDIRALVGAVKTCWASLWTEAAWAYRQRHAIPHEAAAMAVVVQRFVSASASGVAFSADPLTGDRATVVVEAGWGAGDALVGGRMTPDQYRVAMNGSGPVGVRRRAGPHGPSVLSDEQVMELAAAAKALERTLGAPVDLEWVFDGRAFWAVQARSITTLAVADRQPARRSTLWTRANLKEVFPELPSPLALSYLAIWLNRMFRAYHAAQGYTLQDGAELTSVIHGRPYLNLSLMQDLAIERGGDPAIVGRLFGGGGARPRPPGPASRPKLSLAGNVRLAREMLATFFRTPARGRRLFRIMRAEAALLASVPLDTLDDTTLAAHFERFGATLLHESTLRRLHEVVSAQSRAYMVLEALVTAWVPDGDDGVMTRLMTGLGTLLPNVQMTYHLMDLGAVAARESRARAYFMGELDGAAIRDYERALAGTAVLAGLREFLQKFGHRGSYESDVMSPRFAEDPTPVLRMLQLHVRAGGTETAAAHAAERGRLRRAAMAEIRRTLRARRGPLAFATQWAAFSIVCGAVRRLLALRDECRHVTTMLVAHLRRVALEMGRRGSRAGTLADSSDVFFLTWDELPRVLCDRGGDVAAVAAERRRQRAREAEMVAPDLLSDDGVTNGHPAPAEPQNDAELLGDGVSPGVVSGRVRVLRSMEDIGRLSGEIVVFPAIEPTLTPIFPLVHGLVAEIGGLLSHAAILAREYGLPAIVNVPDATRRLRDGDRVELDGGSGRIRVLERAGGA